LASLCLAMLLSSLGTSAANVGLPAMARTFDAAFQEVQWIVLAYLLAITTLVVSVGRLGDVAGRKRLMLAGLVVFTVSSALCGLAPRFWLLVAARAAQGIGAAIMMALTMAMVGETVPKEKTGSAMGLLGTMSAIGTALGPSLGGILIGAFGWRSIFFVNLPLGIVALLLASRFLPADAATARTSAARFDHAGTVLLGLTLGAYALAMTLGRGSFDLANAALLAAALAGAGLFTFAEARVDAPLVRLDMFRDPALSAGFATSALVSTVIMSTLVVGPFYLSGALALSAAQVGIVMSCGPIVSALTGVPAGRIVDRFGHRKAVVAGLAGMTAGCALLSLMPAGFGIPGYVLPLALTTAGYALFQAANNTAVMSDAPPDRRGVMSGLLNLSRNLGLVTGASVMGAIFAFGSRTAGLSSADAGAGVLAGMRLCFAVACALVAVAVMIALAGHALSRPGAAALRTPR
jgi:EmrB/QacA subfamily drug resistance transporter